VITLTEGVDVDAHDCRAPALRRIATQTVARLCKPAASDGLLAALRFGVLPLTYRLKPGSTLDSAS